jgi:hypothetical protein
MLKAGYTMSSARLSPGRDITALPRAVISAAVGVVQTVERAVAGDAHVRTAQRNAWEAVCADRDRARQRAEVRRMVAAIASAAGAGQLSVGSSPRSMASQTATVLAVPPVASVRPPVGSGAARS